MSQMTMTTNKGAIVFEMFDDDAPKTVENFKKLAADGLLRRPHLPPRHQGLHDPGRLPAGHRHGRPRLPVRGRVQRPQGRPRRARDGQLRPEHERLAVLHRHDRRRALARRQAHGLRRGRRRAWTSSTRSRGWRPTRATARARTPRSRSSRPPREGTETMATVEQQQSTGTAVENPATGEVIGNVQAVSVEQLRAMAERGRAAQPAWEALGFDGRAADPAPRPEVDRPTTRSGSPRRSSPSRARPTRTRCSPRSPTPPTRSASGPSTRPTTWATSACAPPTRSCSAASSSCATARSGSSA